MKKLSLLFYLLLLSITIHAQKLSPEKGINNKWAIDLSVGWPVIGPNFTLKQTFHEYGMQTRTSSGFFSSKEHPLKKSTPYLEIALARVLDHNSDVTGYFGYSGGEISLSGSRGHLAVKHQDYRLGLDYRQYSSSRRAHFTSGISLNGGDIIQLASWGSDEIAKKQQYFVPGLSIGCGFSIMENKRAYSRINLMYNFAPFKVKVGPYYKHYDPIVEMEPQLIVPEEEMYMQWFILRYVMGWRF